MPIFKKLAALKTAWIRTTGVA